MGREARRFCAGGRKKAVTKSGDYNKTEVYFYDGQRIIETRNGSSTVVSQFIAPLTRRCGQRPRAAERHLRFAENVVSRANGTQYIDELVMMRVKDKGDLYVHQDANWNVIATTDLGCHVVERSVYTPYGELTVHQDTGFGDRDGDQDVDSTDKGTVGTTCTGTVSGSCRILDLDFDGDYDSTDATKFDALTQGAMRHPGRPATNVSQPFAHQGLLFEPELAQYQNRARQYDPGKRRFVQMDYLGTTLGNIIEIEFLGFEPAHINPGLQFTNGSNLFQYVKGQPLVYKDWSGFDSSECSAFLCGRCKPARPAAPCNETTGQNASTNTMATSCTYTCNWRWCTCPGTCTCSYTWHCAPHWVPGATQETWIWD